jgi:hypothetical protein
LLFFKNPYATNNFLLIFFKKPVTRGFFDFDFFFSKTQYLRSEQN